MLKVGVVGGGHIIKHRHLPVFKKIKEVEVSAVCDKQPSIARSVATQFGIKNSYTDLSEMLKMNLDIVDIATPPKTHVALVTEALEAGCHVLAEKPLALTAEDVDELFKVSKKMGVKLCVVHQNLFNPAYQKAKALFRSGALGDLISVEVGTFNRKNNYMCVTEGHWCHKLPGGIFFEILPHPIYLLQDFLNNPKPAFVLAKKLGTIAWMKADEVRILLDADNAAGLVVASCNSPIHGDTINIFGTKMYVQVDLWGRSIIKHKPRSETPISVGKSNLSLTGQFLGLLGTTISNSVTMAVGGVKVSAHYGFLREFIRSVQTDGEPPVGEEKARENVVVVGDICKKIDSTYAHLK